MYPICHHKILVNDNFNLIYVLINFVLYTIKWTKINITIFHKLAFKNIKVLLLQSDLQNRKAEIHFQKSKLSADTDKQNHRGQISRKCDMR